MDEQGVVRPAHERHRRVYIAQDVLEICILSDLRRKGMSLQKCRFILPMIRKYTMSKPILSRDILMVADGRWVRFGSREEVLGLLTEARRALYVVGITQYARAIIEESHRPVTVALGM